MTAFIAKQVSKKILGETAANKFGKEDYWFDSVPATRLDGRPNGKMKQKLKAFDSHIPGVSREDMKVMTKVKRRAYRLDMSLFSCCGVRFGWSSVIGIIPAIGDVLDAFMAIMVVNTCKQVEGGLPSSVLSKMYFNVIVDFFIGLVPFLGDVADAVFRANTKNAIVLEDYLREEGKKKLRASGMPVPPKDPSDGEVFDQLIAESPKSGTVKSQPGQHVGMTADSLRDAQTPQSSGVTEPSEARVREDRRGGGGFFGFGSKKSRLADVENGNGRR